jgi:hypothetical protein
VQRIVNALFAAVVALIPALAIAQAPASHLASATHAQVVAVKLTTDTAGSPGGPGLM